MARSLTALLVLALISSACEAAPAGRQENVLDPTELTQTGGCADAFVYATNAANTVALTINWAQAASRAQATGEFDATATLPDDEVTVHILFGQRLSSAFCTDILTEPGGSVAEATAWDGEVDIRAVPAPGAEPFMPLAGASLTLRDVVFEVPVEGKFETWRIESLELRDVQVGWFAG